ncbi:TetR family transcriptional regulator [Nonomuraea jiangxiensis]|uniref:DNA-binding transcriptional regulator, AcrR family n=1 Tax=Nonomuraea jiangxiensis TaxID=633440 RepID=A0A1G9UBV3_9ACTN|nr:TetR family transcriptional regulator [Nonomuraea jiangxiensis]SDM57430.1 DNA-binding transcriptional regulator, AcrR family [Nonomuraea jiangxiensis]
MTADISPASAPGTLSLRERKKLKTRAALVDTALVLFTERGFDRVTLDELCEAVEVSKRTFFRNFAGKEQVASAPLEALWNGLRDDVEHLSFGRAPVLEVLQEALLVALARMDDGGPWVTRVRRSRELAERTPSIAAYGLQYCEVTSAAIEATLQRRLGLDPADPRPRLALDLVVASFHVALRAWTAKPGAPTHAALTAELRSVFAVLPGALTFSMA